MPSCVEISYVLSSLSSANRGPNTRPYGLRLRRRPIEDLNTVSVHGSDDLPSASASEVPMESSTTESLPIASEVLTTDPPFRSQETESESVSEVVFDCQDDSVDEPTEIPVSIPKKRPRKPSKRERKREKQRIRSLRRGRSSPAKKRRKKSEPELADEFSIPDYQAIVQILGKLDFETRDERYYLPPQCWVGKEEVEDIAYFSSTEKLRQNLCSKGIPESTTALTDEEEMELRSWVRYSIADPYLDDPQKCPAMMPMESTEAQKVVTKLGAVCSSSSYQWYAEKDKPPYDTWHEFEDFLTREGLSRLPDEKQQGTDCPVLLKVDLLRLAVYLADNDRIELL